MSRFPPNTFEPPLLTACTRNLIERVDDRYVNGPTARAWFTPASQVDFTPGLLWVALPWHMVEDLSQVVRKGGPQHPLYEYLQDDPEKGRIMAQYQSALAKLSVGPIT